MINAEQELDECLLLGAEATCLDEAIRYRWLNKVRQIQRNKIKVVSCQRKVPLVSLVLHHREIIHIVANECREGAQIRGRNVSHF